MGGSCPTHIDRWISFFFFSPDKDMHTSPRTTVAMTTAEVEGEQVSGTACFLKFFRQGLRLQPLKKWKNSCWQCS